VPVTAIVLAAGRAERFGGPKQAEPIDGVPMVARAVRAARDGGADRVLVVCGGPYEAAVRAALGEGGGRGDSVAATLVRVDGGGLGDSVAATPVRVDGGGLGDSLAARVRAAPAGDDVLVLRADQPRVGPEAVRRVLAARPAAGAPRSLAAVRASYGGRPGHPALLLARLRPRLLTLAGDRGAAAVLAAEEVALVPCDDVAADVDVDTREDLHRVEARGRRGHQDDARHV
jgi:CTP:molybdopterin cytidylyltransferase MocA